MGGDYTRFTFRPENDYTSVLRQQGRVALDADHNEFADILDRRWRAETIDILGRCTVPRDPVDGDGKPQSFRISLTGYGAGSFAIGSGRAYVDGILADCRGDPGSVAKYDAGLGETYFTGALPWSAQPHLPQPPYLTRPAAEQVDLIYLDVWQREVTAIEDPELREVALGGPDTTTRLQTLWQVRVEQDVKVTECADAHATEEWKTLTAPSGGRLTSSPDPGFSPDDEPCTIGPAGGYRGLENRLYRVEIQKPGNIAANSGAVNITTTAFFKWSRDNASYVSGVEHLEQGVDAAGDDVTFVTVRLIGRDPTMRFQVDDWVEVLDDYTEFRQQAGQMSKVTDVNEAERIITLNPPLDLTDSVLDPAHEALGERHTRVRRWGKDALQPVTKGTISLGDGIQIELSLVEGGAFHIGDYWVFTARTSTGLVEPLTLARPRGILHHYGALALIPWGTDQASTEPEIVDCRTLWPPKGGEGCCTVMVFPGDDVQAAIDSLPPEGGCVCLKTGVHGVGKTIRVEKSNICIEGESPGVVVKHAIGGPVFRIASTDESTIERVGIHGVAFELGDPGGALIEIDRLAYGKIEHCRFNNTETAAAPIGLVLTGSSGLTIEGNAFENGIAGIIAGTSGALTVAGNVFHGPTAQDEQGNTFSTGFVGVLLDDEMAGPCHIERNYIAEFLRGIVIGTGADGSVVRDNEIRRTGVAPRSGNEIEPEGSSFGVPRDYAVACAAPDCEIAGNLILLDDAGHGGVHVTASHVRVVGNLIRSQVQAPNDEIPLWLNPLGVFLDDALGRQRVDSCILRDNVFLGVQNAISVGDAPPSEIYGVEIVSNLVEGRADVVKTLADPFEDPEEPLDFSPKRFSQMVNNYAIRAVGLRDGIIAHNQILSVPCAVSLLGGKETSLADNHLRSGIIGVFLSGARNTTLTGTHLSDMAFGGVFAYKSTRVHVSTAHVQGPGWWGVIATEGAGVHLHGCLVENTRVGVCAMATDTPRITDSLVRNASEGGIVAVSCLGTVVCDRNEVIACGFEGLSVGLFMEQPAPPPDQRIGAGILIVSMADPCTIASCRVIGTGRSSDGKTVFSGSTAAIMAFFVGDCRAQANEVEGAAGLVPDEQHHAIAVYAVPQASHGGGRKSSVEALDNAVSGFGATPVLVGTYGGLVFSNNRISHVVPPPPQGAAPPPSAVCFAPTTVLSGNRVEATDKAAPSFRILGAYLTAVGNLTSGQWDRPGVSTTIPAPFDQFNLIGVP